MDISKLLTFMAKEGASDCHISTGEPPMIRVNGDLKKLDHPALTTDETHSLIYDMMSDTQRKNFEEKRECDFSFELGDIARFRVNVFVQTRGLGAVFRNIPTTIIPMEKLGMPPIVRQLCDREKGLILVTGPTGSGKSTTLASMVDYLNNTFEGHIITIEDPIECIHKTTKCLVNQREMGVHTRTQIAEALEGVITQTLLKKKSGGRVAALEIMVATTAVRNLIREGKLHQIPGVMQASQKDGMQTMDMALYDLAMRGVVTKGEAQSRSMNPNLFGTAMGGAA
ncbi:MAG: hypothetical protein E6K66_09145 [Nitrospirae bacterium]|nr:MAG: hypothetical protein E6K66_09145 [Nitrospirota bacterium]